jgi:demethylmenaquinone methyltransferase / 2-methoxy-6-polyprenyl-1,4-benzoquinol methylase
LSRSTSPRRGAARALGRLTTWRAEALGPEQVSGRMADHEVRGMFEATAATYDVQNGMLSLGIDRHWRKIFVERLRPRPGSVIGDMAVGTGEISLGVASRYRDVRIVGVDFTPGMLRVARRKVRERGLEDRIELRQGDLRAIPLPDASLDAVTMSFGIRNIGERARVLSEICRVLRPGGFAQIMEMSIPTSGIARALYSWYFEHLMPVLGNWLSRTDYAYSYLKHSVYEFPSDPEFFQEMRAAGLDRPSAFGITFDTARIYRAIKPARAA